MKTLFFSSSSLFKLALSLVLLSTSACGIKFKNEFINETLSNASSSLSSFLGIKQLGLITGAGVAATFDASYDITTDSSGNIFIVGNTLGSLGEANGGGMDAFVSKWSSTGSLIWIKQFGAVTIGAGSSGSDTASAVATDSSGNIFVAGHSNGALGETNGGSGDAFIAKLDTSGTLLWMRQLGNITIGVGASGNDQVWGITIDPSGNAIVGGVVINGSLGEAPTFVGAANAFAAKWNTSGTLQWVRQLGNTTLGSATASSNAQDITSDTLGDIYITGNGSGNLGEADGGGNDFFISKWNSAGVYQWSRQLGTTTLGGASSGNDFGMGIRVNTLGEIFVGGTSNGNMGEANGGGYDVVLAKWNAAGVFQWVEQAGAVTLGAASSGSENGTNMAMDSSSNLYFMGTTDGNLGEVSGGGNDLFVQTWNGVAGTFTQTKQLGSITGGAGTSGGESAGGVCLSPSGGVISTGWVFGSVGEANGGSSDIFFWGY